MNETFIKAYAANMKAESDANPGRYMLPPFGWEELARRICVAIVAGTANISNAAKKTAKQLGGKPTCAGVTEMVIKGT